MIIDYFAFIWNWDTSYHFRSRISNTPDVFRVFCLPHECETVCRNWAVYCKLDNNAVNLTQTYKKSMKFSDELEPSIGDLLLYLQVIWVGNGSKKLAQLQLTVDDESAILTCLVQLFILKKVLYRSVNHPQTYTAISNLKGLT